MSYTESMRPKKVDLTSPGVYTKQAMAEITQRALIKSELTSRNDNSYLCNAEITNFSANPSCGGERATSQVPQEIPSHTTFTSAINCSV